MGVFSNPVGPILNRFRKTSNPSSSSNTGRSTSGSKFLDKIEELRKKPPQSQEPTKPLKSLDNPNDDLFHVETGGGFNTKKFNTSFRNYYHKHKLGSRIGATERKALTDTIAQKMKSMRTGSTFTPKGEKIFRAELRKNISEALKKEGKSLQSHDKHFINHLVEKISKKIDN